jgi:hypothetical protein
MASSIAALTNFKILKGIGVIYSLMLKSNKYGAVLITGIFENKNCSCPYLS